MFTCAHMRTCVNMVLDTGVRLCYMYWGAKLFQINQKEAKMQSLRRLALLGGTLLFLSAACTFSQAPDTIWTRTYGGPNHNEGLSVQETMDGGYIMTGYTVDFGGGLRNVWLVKTDANGDTALSLIHI